MPRGKFQSQEETQQKPRPVWTNDTYREMEKQIADLKAWAEALPEEQFVQPYFRHPKHLWLYRRSINFRTADNRALSYHEAFTSKLRTESLPRDSAGVVQWVITALPGAEAVIAEEQWRWYMEQKERREYAEKKRIEQLEAQERHHLFSTI